MPAGAFNDIFGFSLEEDLSSFLDLYSKHAEMLDFISVRSSITPIFAREQNIDHQNPFIKRLRQFHVMLAHLPSFDLLRPLLLERAPLLLEHNPLATDRMRILENLIEPAPSYEDTSRTLYIQGQLLLGKLIAAVNNTHIPELEERLKTKIRLNIIVQNKDESKKPLFLLREKIRLYSKDTSIPIETLGPNLLQELADDFPKLRRDLLGILVPIYAHMFMRPMGDDSFKHGPIIAHRELIPALEQMLTVTFDREPHEPNFQDEPQPWDKLSTRQQSLACIFARQLIEVITELATRKSQKRNSGDTPDQVIWEWIKEYSDMFSQSPSTLARYIPTSPDSLREQCSHLYLHLKQLKNAVVTPQLQDDVETGSTVPDFAKPAPPGRQSFTLQSYFYPISCATAVTYLRLLTGGTLGALITYDALLTEPDPTADYAFLAAIVAMTAITNALRFFTTSRRDLSRYGGESTGCLFLKNPAAICAVFLALTGIAIGAVAGLNKLVIETENLNADGQHQSSLNTFAVYALTLATYTSIALGAEVIMQALSIITGTALHCSAPRSCFRNALSRGTSFSMAEGVELPEWLPERLAASSPLRSALTPVRHHPQGTPGTGDPRSTQRHGATATPLFMAAPGTGTRVESDPRALLSASRERSGQRGVTFGATSTRLILDSDALAKVTVLE